MSSLPPMSVAETVVAGLTVGKRIRWTRRAMGLSMDKLAARLGTSRRQVIRWEQDVNRPGPVYVARLAEVLEQPLSYFLNDDEEDAA